jgi:peptidoglycan hydrolase CwlO-like protein
MITKHKIVYMLAFTSIVLASVTSISFASDNTQQIAAVSQEIQTLQERLSAANNKIEQLCEPCDSTTYSFPQNTYKTTEWSRCLLSN